MSTVRIIYGTLTGSIEDFDQCRVVDVPEDMSTDTVEQILHQGLLPHNQYKHIVVWEDLVDELKHILWEVPHMHPARPALVIHQLAEALNIQKKDAA